MNSTSVKNQKTNQSTAAQFFNLASEAEDSGRVQEARKLYLRAANLGDCGAQNNLGNLYSGIPGIRVNRKRALYWFKKSWRTGNESHACMNIASTYADMGDDRQARKWWRVAAATGTARNPG